MLRISERFDFEREFARKGELLDFDIPRPIEIIPPDAIYTSPGGTVSEDFSPKEPIPGPDVLPKPIGWPPPKLPVVPEYATTPKMVTRPYRPEIDIKGLTSTPGKNFLDLFFDWMNKILSGK